MSERVCYQRDVGSTQHLEQDFALGLQSGPEQRGP